MVSGCGKVPRLAWRHFSAYFANFFHFPARKRLKLSEILAVGCRQWPGTDAWACFFILANTAESSPSHGS